MKHSSWLWEHIKLYFSKTLVSEAMLSLELAGVVYDKTRCEKMVHLRAKAIDVFLSLTLYEMSQRLDILKNMHPLEVSMLKALLMEKRHQCAAEINQLYFQSVADLDMFDGIESIFFCERRQEMKVIISLAKSKDELLCLSIEELMNQPQLIFTLKKRYTRKIAEGISFPLLPLASIS